MRARGDDRDRPVAAADVATGRHGLQPQCAARPGARHPSGTLAPFGIVQTTLQERDETHVKLTVEETQRKAEPGSDAALLMEGWMTLTALDAVSHVALGVADDELRSAAGA